MKIDINIKDCSAEEAKNILSFLYDGHTDLGKSTIKPKHIKAADAIAQLEKEQAEEEAQKPVDPNALFGDGQQTPPAPPVVNAFADISGDVPATNFASNTVIPAAVDSKGLPWDERIHASTKTQNKDGSWKRRKGVEDSLVEQVEAEYKSNTPAAPVAPSINAQSGVPAAPTPPAPPAPPAPPVATAPVEQPPFQKFLQTINNLFATQTIDSVYMAELPAKIGEAFKENLTSITDIMNRPEMVEWAFEKLRVDGKIA